MRRDATGHYEITCTAGEAVRAFVPAPLPPVTVRKDDAFATD